MRRVLRILKWLVLAVVVAIAATIGWGYHVLRASQPRLSGELAVPGLDAAVNIARDQAGIPVVAAASRRDAAFATGFLHAQERFFQMDLARRIGAGELAELFGDNVLPIDRDFRRHRLRQVAEQAVAALPEAQRAVLTAYVDGVNAGLNDLGRAPLEYAVTRTTPRPWAAADTMLVILNMFILLQDRNGEQEFARHVLYQRFPREVADFLAVAGDPDWDAPLAGDPVAATPLPSSTLFSLREQPASAPLTSRERAPISGSNAWAMSGTFTANGAAIVANDMHLGFSVPNTFYRVQLQWGEADSARRLVGVTLPGVPALVAGSNGDIAWGLTNSAGDFSDIVLLEDYAADRGTFRSAQGNAAVTPVVERILVKGDADEAFAISMTPWGPVRTADAGRSHYAVRWVAHDAAAVNLGLLALEEARSSAAALALGPTIGIPAQNLIVGDRAGAIGWTIAGRLPLREHGDGIAPARSSTTGPLWSGWQAAADYPQILNPGSGRLWTANARVVDGAGFRAIGLGYYALGARARQIRDRLFEMTAASESGMLAVQMDHRALFLRRWQTLLGQVVAAGTPAQQQALTPLLADWDGTAARGSAAYPYIRGFRERVRDRVFTPYVAMARELYPEFELDQISDQYEAPLWQLVSARPPHLLPAQYRDWDELLQSALTATLSDLEHGGGPGKATWGSFSRLQMHHPMSAFIPGFAPLYDMPSAPLDGDVHMPLAQIADHGPVQRMAVRPGAEESGYLTMPGGQSAHPLTPYYAAGHEQWIAGAVVPLLAGAPVYQLRLVPR